jgi:hypothetical protein
MEQKPFILEVEESKDELVQCVNHIVNDRGVPCYFIVSTLENILQQVKAGAKNELKLAMEHSKSKETEE